MWRKRDVIRLGKQHKVEVKLRRIPVILRGLLEIHTVRINLNRELLLEDGQPMLLPARGSPQFRQHCAKIEQPERLSGEMRVWAEIRGEIRLQMPSVNVQRLQKARVKRWRECRRRA